MHLPINHKRTNYGYTYSETVIFQKIARGGRNERWQGDVIADHLVLLDFDHVNHIYKYTKKSKDRLSILLS